MEQIIVIFMALAIFGIACAVAIAAATYVDAKDAKVQKKRQRRTETRQLAS